MQVKTADYSKMSHLSERRSPRRQCSAGFRALAVVVLGLTFISSFALIAPTPAGATVTEDVRTGLPIVEDGKVYDIEQVGDYVVVGGTFTHVLLQDGTNVPQPYLYAYHAETGEFADHFRPVLDDSVLALVPKGDDKNIFVGGSFGYANERRRKNVAMYNVNTGAISTKFIANVNSQVATMAVSDRHLYMGGSFKESQQLVRNGLLRVDIETGDIDPTFDFGSTVEAGRPLSWPPDINGVPQPPNRQGGVVTVDVTPDNTRLVVLHRGLLIGGQSRPGLATIDITNGGGTLTSFVASTPDLAEPIYGMERCNNQGIRVTDMEISPDGSYFVVTHTGADGLLVCDQIHRYETFATGATAPTWRTRAFDSVFSVAIDDDAVYVGGHFRYLPHPKAPSAYPGRIDNPMNPWNIYEADPVTDPTFQDELVSPGYVYRAEQIGALSPYTGKGMPTWNPTSNAFKGVLDLTITDRGLLLGQDNDRVQETLTGYAAEFDNGDFINVALGKAVRSSAPIGGNVANNVVDGNTDPVASKFSTAAGSPAFVDVDLGESVPINRLNVFGPNTNFSTNFADISVFVSKVPFGSDDLAATRAQSEVTEYRYVGERSSQLHLRNVVNGRYVRVATSNQQLDVAEIKVWSRNPAPTCTVRKLNPTTVEVSWTNARDTTVIVRRNDVFAGSSTGPDGALVDTVGTAGTYSYLARTSSGGVVTDTQCGSASIGTPAMNCTATIAGSDVKLNWDGIGVSSYSVRRNDRFIASSTVTNYTDAAPGAGTYSYEVRAFVDGVKITESCGSVSFTAPSCSATALGGGAKVTWQNANGDALILRRNSKFLATVTGTSSFTDPALAGGANVYELRIRANGTVTDVPCGSVSGAAPTCTAASTSDGVQLSWSDLGASSYSIRRNGSFLASTNGLSFTDFTPPPGNVDYVIRTSQGDMACGSLNVTAPSCTATGSTLGVLLSWTDIGASSYSIRRNGSFLASTNGLSFTDPLPPVGTVSYLIRTGQGDIDCGTIVIN